MELRHLRVFAAAAELRNFGAAADRLNITAPAVSQQIKMLEQELGFQLFQRVRRGVELTAAGEAMLPEAQAALTQVERAIRVARSARRGETGQIRVGYTYSIMAEQHLPALIHRFNQAHPVVKFELLGGSVKTLIDAVAEEDLDVAFVRLPVGKLPCGLVAHRYTCADLVVVVAANHPLAEQRTVTLPELLSYDLILVDDPVGYGLGHHVAEMFRLEGLQPRIGFRMENVTGIPGMVATGNGISILPRVLAQGPTSVKGVEIVGSPIASVTALICRSSRRPFHVERFIVAGKEEGREQEAATMYGP